MSNEHQERCHQGPPVFKSVNYINERKHEKRIISPATGKRARLLTLDSLDPDEELRKEINQWNTKKRPFPGKLLEDYKYVGQIIDNYTYFGWDLDSYSEYDGKINLYFD